MNHDIIKLLDLKDSDLIIDGPVIKKNKKILTVTKKLEPVFCPVCGSRMHSKGIYTRTVNHPVLQDGYQLILELKQRRWRCTDPLCDNILNDSFSFVQPNKRNTNITDISIVMAFKDLHLSAAQIAERFSVSDTYAINTFARHVDMPRRQLPEIISIDEVHVNVSKVCNYALVIQDFKTGEPVDMIANRRQEITEPYFQNIPFSERKQVKYLISDMYRPYLGYVDKYFPNAVNVVDSFHVIKMINEKLLRYLRDLQRKYRQADEERHKRLEQELGRKVDFTTSKEYYLLKKYKWLILKNQDDIHYSSKAHYNYKLRQYVTIGDIDRMLLRIDPNLKELRDLKERYIRFNKRFGNDYKRSKAELQNLIDLYRKTQYDIFHDVADSLTYHFDAIANSFLMVQRHCAGNAHISRLSNGPMESLNRLVKDLKRNGHGYHNFEHLRNRFLFSQRENASILATPKPLEEVCPKTGRQRGPYKKKEQ